MNRFSHITTPAATLALQRSRYPKYTDEEWRWLLQQVDGRQRTCDKLPTFYTIEGWQYPVRLSCEQCSSEATARYKASLVSGEQMADLTGGYGVDTYYMSERFATADYVEHTPELAAIAQHNFALTSKPITCHTAEAEDYLHALPHDRVYDLLYLDPYRRDEAGGKVFLLEDCTPNVVALMPQLMAHSHRLMLKLSPMLDITRALSSLPGTWDTHVVALHGEVKEVLLLSHGTGLIRAVDLAPHAPWECVYSMEFTREEEAAAPVTYATQPLRYVYEPTAAVMKAAPYRLLSARYGVDKWDASTHLYTADTLVADWPGRVWEVVQVFASRKDLPADLKQANILTRNYPLRPEALKQKLRLKDGGTDYIIAARLMGKPVMLLGKRV